MIRHRRYIAMVLLLAVLLTGCSGKNTKKVPKLVETVSVNFSYRPAEYGYINPPELKFATVTAKEKCYYFPTNVTVTKVMVAPGDTVKKGDILAYADESEAQKQLAELKQDLSYENNIYKLNKKLTAMEIKSLKETKDKIAVKVQQENARYDKQLWQYKVKKLSQDIKECSQLVKDGMIKATEDGQVIYTINLANSNVVGTNDNIVVTSNKSQKYLKLDYLDSKYMDYGKIYTYINGEETKVSQLEYSTAEEVLAKANDMTLDTRLTCDGIDKMDIGTTLPIYFLKGDEEKALLIGQDSLYLENGKYFVYIKDKNKQRKKQEITIGRQSSNYCEVTHGLEEGDSVYYESDSVVPSEYDTCLVKKDKYAIKNYSRTYESAGDTAIHCKSKYQGKIGDLITKTEFKKGDLLYSVDTGEGQAVLLEAANAIKRENNSYKKTCKDYKKQKKESKDDKQQLKKIELQEKISKLEHENTISKLQQNYSSLKENNNGKGKYNVYAAFDGKVEEINVKDGQMIEVDEEVLTVATGQKNLLVVSMQDYSDAGEKTKNIPENIADIGEKITAVTGKQNYEGICIGIVGDGKKYVEETSDGAHVSQNVNEGYEQKSFLVKMDADFYKDMPQDAIIKFNYLDIPEVLLIPRQAICKEQDVETAQDRLYVWRKADGEIEKQFITISDDEGFNNSEYVPVLSGVSEGDEIIVTTGNQ